MTLKKDRQVDFLPVFLFERDLVKGEAVFMYVMKQTGWIEVICGSMFSGKSEELIRRVRRAQFAKQKIAIFKPSLIIAMPKKRLYRIMVARLWPNRLSAQRRFSII